MSDSANNDPPSLIAHPPERAYASLCRADLAHVRSVQDELLKKHLAHAAQNSPFYRSLFADCGVDINQIAGVDDLAKLPFTSKKQLAENNDDFLAVDRARVVDLCLTSATTTDTPTMLAQTASDLARLAYNEEVAFATAGIGSDDTLMVCAAIDRCFMAGLAYFLGGLKLGSTIVRAGSGNPAQQWHLVEFTRPTAIVGVPSLLRKIGEYALSENINPASAGVSKLIAIGEPIRDKNLELLPSCRRLEEIFGAKLFSTYASTEMASAFCECEHRCGGHQRPELIIVEIVDESGKIVPDGEAGEVIVTPLGVEGMPLVRFRTGDVSFRITERCACGRSSPRIGPLLGRKDQMLKLKGTTLFPGTILAMLEAHDGAVGGYVEAYSNEDGTDRVVVCAVPTNDSVTAEQIAGELQAHLRVIPEVRLITKEQYETKVAVPGKRKATTFFDMRSQS